MFMSNGAIQGLSTDTKPASPQSSWTFIETDTGKSFNVIGGIWSVIVPDLMYIKDEPIIIANGYMYNIPNLLWTDASVFSERSFTNLSTTCDFTAWPGAMTQFVDEPFIITNNTVVDLSNNPATILWTDAARSPRTVSTLLVIGV